MGKNNFKLDGQQKINNKVKIMSHQKTENLSPGLRDLVSRHSLRQFAETLKKRRTLEQKQLQFVKAVQSKYLTDEETDPLTASRKGFVQKIRARGWIAKRSLKTNPLNFANALPLEITAKPAELASMETEPSNLVVNLFPEMNQDESLEPTKRTGFNRLVINKANKLDGSLTEVASPNILKQPGKSILAKGIKYTDEGKQQAIGNRQQGKTKTSNDDSWQYKPSNEIKELESKVDQSNFLILESSVQAFLSRILDLRVSGIKIYNNTLADTLVKKYDADALTYPNKILFRLGKYNPKTMAGLALLGHELTHLEQFNGQNESSVSENVTAKVEDQALANEAKIFGYILAEQNYSEQTRSLGINPQRDIFIDSSAKTTQPPSVKVKDMGESSPVPKTALPERNINLPLSEAQSMKEVASISAMELNLIKEEVYRDLKQRLQIEFERGS